MIFPSFVLVVIVISSTTVSSLSDDNLNPFNDVSEILLEKCPNHQKHIYAPKCLWNNLFPLAEDCESLPVEIDIVPKQFRWIDDPRQEFTFLAQIKMSWPLFCPDLITPNRTLIVDLARDKFWQPILIHMNSAGNPNLDTDQVITALLIILSPQGSQSTFRIIKYGLLTSTISMEFENFPFDVQRMSIEFALMANNYRNYISSIKIPSMIGNDYFMPHGMTWKFDEFSPNCTVDDLRNSATFSGRETSASLATCTMDFKRKYNFYIYSYILPCLFLTAIELFSFFMPAFSTDRPVFAVTLLLSLTMVQGAVQTIVPVKEERTFLSDYTQMSMLLSWLCSVYNLIICGFECSYESFFRKSFKFGKRSLTRSRLFDFVAFSVGLAIFLIINISAIDFALQRI